MNFPTVDFLRFALSLEKGTKIRRRVFTSPMNQKCSAREKLLYCIIIKRIAL